MPAHLKGARTRPGDRFGLWTVLELPPRSTASKALCRCACGTERLVSLDNLRAGKTVSCGLCQREEMAKRAARARVRHPVYVGQKFGRLTVMSCEDRSHVLVRCACGNQKTVNSVNLYRGATQSCGCLAAENRKFGPKRKTHGLKKHPLYSTWTDIIGRCTNPDDHDWRYYGGRGIQVCDRWLDVTSFVLDIERDLGPRPAGLTLDRINNDGHYEPGNVRWATRLEQMHNTRQCKRPLT